MQRTKRETKNVLIWACFGALALVLMIGNSFTHAQEYPSKPVTMIVPAPPGGTMDTIGRLTAHAMDKVLGQRIIVENVGGAGATIGSARVARSSPDGYTILLQHIGMAVAPALYKKLTYDPITDFEPIGRVTDLPMTLIARKDFPAKDFKEMLAYIKANKDKINLADASKGGSTHLCALVFMDAIETELTSISYKGGGPAMADILGGRVDLYCDSTATTLGHIQSGAVKTYCVTSRTRVSSLPDVPTSNEVGVPAFEIAVWHGLWAPKGTPKPIIDKLSAALLEALKDPILKQRLADFGTEPVPQQLATPEALRAFLQAETKKWTPLIKKSGGYLD